MGILSQQFRGRTGTPQSQKQSRDVQDIAVGAKNDMDVTITFNDKNITFSSSISGYDYDSILRNKQKNITRLYELSDYYVDVDPIYRGIIKEVYTPFSISDPYRLIGADEKVKQKYQDYYDRIHLNDKMASIFYQYYKYGNVFVYLMEDGTIMTLPVHLIRIANVMVNGEPVIEINCRSIKDDLVQQGVKAKKDYQEDDDLDVRLQGFPKEVVTAVKEGKEYVQLNPDNTFVLQDIKEDWMRYSIPMVASCLKAFEKKELISTWENARLKLGMGSFVHVKYGDPDNEVIPDINALRQVSAIFKQAMTGSALAVTNNWCTAEVIEPNQDHIFEYDKYKGVNADILSAGGISGVIVSGRAEDGSTFASAQVSMQTAALRIKQAKDNFCDMMNKINMRLNGSSPAMPHSADDKIPRFTFPPVDLSGNKAFQEACLKLWEKGVVSDKTLLQTYGYDIGQEVERKKQEQSSGTSAVLSPKDLKDSDSSSDDIKAGRPTMDDSERMSDPSKSVTGRQPKGSRPQGSTSNTS